MHDLLTTLQHGLLVLVLAGKAYSVTFRPEVTSRTLLDSNDSRALLGVDDRTAALIVGTRCLGTLVCDEGAPYGEGAESRVAELYDVSAGTPRLLDVIDWTPLG